uniref:Uncharacterized protein n=1 Tax=viral metagenome TaxID=1070528 RepID=A0A6H2A694_9ZZZZ
MRTIEQYISDMKAGHHFIKSGVWRDIESELGRKYVKVVSILSNGQRSAIEFIDPESGKVFRADSWRQKGRWIANL